MKKPQLILSTTSPYARKVKITALENKENFETVIDVPWNENTGVINFNPLGKVPVWVTADGEAIFDSRVIVEYLEIKNSNKFSSVNPREYLIIKKLESLCEGVMDASLSLFVERKKRPKDLQYSWWIERQFSKLHRALQILQEKLGTNQYLYGNRLTVADFALVSALGYVQLRFSEDFSLANKYPRLFEYYNQMMKRESVKSTEPVI